MTTLRITNRLNGMSIADIREFTEEAARLGAPETTTVIIDSSPADRGLGNDYSISLSWTRAAR